MSQQQNKLDFENMGPRVLIIIGLAITLIVGIWKSSITIPAGHAGVLFKTFSGGIDTENVYPEGFAIIAPWNKMVIYEVRQQEITEDLDVLCSAGLDIHIEVSCWYKPTFSQLGMLHKEKGERYLDRVVRPTLLSATRSVIGKYAPEEIYSSQKDVIQEQIEKQCALGLEGHFVDLERVVIRDITLPVKIQQAIERKQEEEQLAEQYDYKLERAKKEAERINIEATGKAEANRILNASLTPNILKEKGIEATLKLSESSNAKVVVVGNSDGLPLILGNN